MTTDEQIAEWKAKGLKIEVKGGPAAMVGEKRPTARRAPRALVAASFVVDVCKGPTWVVPLYVMAGDNLSGKNSKKRVGRAGHERLIVADRLAAHLEAVVPFAKRLQRGVVTTVVLTRLGGNRLDRWDNLNSSMKYVLDTVCLFLGIRDSNPALRVEYDQRPGRRAHGVEIRLEARAS